jgi:hypothetical protein
LNYVIVSPSELGNYKIADKVDDVDACHAAAVQAGAEIVYP